MTAREKIQGLTNGWLGYVFFTAVLSYFQSDRGIVGSAIGLAISLLLVWLIGNRLLAKSSLTRLLLLVISTLAVVLGTAGVLQATWVFLHEWSLRLLLGIVFGAVSIAMHVKSLRVLTDSSVKAYFA